MRFFRLLFPLLAAAVLLAGLMSRDRPADSPYGARMMALEFARSQSDVDSLVQNDAQKKELNRQLNLDTRFVIPIYWLFFVGINAFILGNWVAPRRGLLWMLPLALPIVISFAVIADLGENAAASASLNQRIDAAQIYPAAVAKWSAIALACILLGLGFLGIGRKRWTVVAAAAYVAAGAGIALALVQSTPWVENAVGIMVLSIGITGEAICAERRDSD